MKKICLAAESGADIPQELAKQYDIRIVPMHVMMGEICRDDGSFPVKDVFDYYGKYKKIPTTSAPSPDEYRKVFEQLHREEPEAVILHLCYSAATSATMQNARIASDGLDYVRHVDTKAVSAAQGILAVRAARFIRQNEQAEAEQLMEQLEDWISRCHMAFLPDNLDYLHAGGRVSNAAYMGASLLRLKPLIEIVDGKLVCTRKYHGSMNKVYEKFLRDILGKYSFEKDQVYLLGSEGLDESIRRQAEAFMTEQGCPELPWRSTGTVVSVHGGPGAFGLIWFEAER